jgi:hypothetical protein
MTAAHAAPITTIATADVQGESHSLMVENTERARSIYVAARAGGLSKGEALRKAGPAIKAAQLAQIKHRAELAYATAG